MDIIGISGLVISIAGFGLSLWQLRKTRRAAEAAELASRDAIRSMRFIYAVAHIHDICGRSRDLLLLVRTKNLSPAAAEAFELRDLIARFPMTDAGRLLASSIDWATIIEDVCSIHEQLELAAEDNDQRPEERAALIHKISKIHSQLTALAASATDQGVHHGHP